MFFVIGDFKKHAFNNLCIDAVPTSKPKVAAGVQTKVHEAAEHGELDLLIEKQAQFDRRVTQRKMKS